LLQVLNPRFTVDDVDETWRARFDLWTATITDFENLSGENVQEMIKCALLLSNAPRDIQPILQARQELHNDYQAMESAVRTFLQSRRRFDGVQDMEVDRVAEGGRRGGGGGAKGACWTCGSTTHRHAQCPKGGGKGAKGAKGGGGGGGHGGNGGNGGNNGGGGKGNHHGPGGGGAVAVATGVPANRGPIHNAFDPRKGGGGKKGGKGAGKGKGKGKHGGKKGGKGHGKVREVDYEQYEEYEEPAHDGQDGYDEWAQHEDGTEWDEHSQSAASAAVERVHAEAPVGANRTDLWIY
jgi:hypothetical protein